MRYESIVAIVLAMTAGAMAADTWTSTGRDAEYPAELYFVGVGMSERGQDAAKQAAVVEVKKQLSVKVNAGMLDEQISLTAGGRETSINRVESRAMLTTSGEVAGIQTVKTAQQGKIWYALAVLDKKNFATNSRVKVQELKAQIKKLIEGASADITAAAIPQALGKLSETKRLLSQLAEQRTLLSAAVPVTEEEKLDITPADINSLYEKCVADLRMTKTGGDKQTFAVGMVPEQPFAVKVTARDVPVAMIPVAVMLGTKRLLEKFTDDKGQAEFLLGDMADGSSGAHSYTVAMVLPVSSTVKKYLVAQNQTFDYAVTSNPCFASITVDATGDLATGGADLSKKVIDRLAKYDIKQDPQSENKVTVSLSATETGNVQGLSENNTFIKTEVTGQFTVVDDDGKQVASFTGKGKGTGGSLVKSVANGIDNMRVEKELKSALEKICGASTTAAKKKIAVFEFKNRGFFADWYDMSIRISDMVITKLINSGRFDVIERSQLDKILEEKQLAQSGVVEDNEAAQAALVAGADLLLVGSATLTGGQIEVDGRVIDAKSGVAKCAMSTTGYSTADLRGLADDLVGQIKSKCAK